MELVKRNKYGGVIAEPPEGIHRDVWIYKLCVSHVESQKVTESLQARIKELEGERDKAVKDILIAEKQGRCYACKHMKSDAKENEQVCQKWPNRECFEWRGMGGNHEHR